MKIRIKFTKLENMQYVGHLDLMRYFQKAIARAALPVAYSVGYNPHQLISFAAPLGLGITSIAEYLDLDITEKCPEDEITQRLNAQMVDGIDILETVYLEDKAQKAMSIVTAIDYTIYSEDKSFDFNIFKRIESIQHLPMLKITKKTEKNIDIKPLIYQMKSESDSLMVRLASGSVSNLKPTEMMKVFFEQLNLASGYEKLRYIRTEIYGESQIGMQPLNKMTGAM